MERYKDNEWTKSMKISFDFNNVMSTYIDEQGITEEEIDNLENLISDSISRLKAKRSLELEWMNLPYTQDEVVSQMLEYAKEIQDNYENLVLIGIGGQALGPIAVHYALNHLFYNELPSQKRKYPRFYVPDNTDPERLTALFDVIDITKTKFFISSKSGSTSETMAQFLIIVDLLKQKLGNDYKNHIICTTDTEKGNLIKIIQKEGYVWFPMPSKIGGRYSELCSSGLLPAAVCGIDIKELLAGAAFIDKYCSNDDFYNNPAYMGAIIQYLLIKKGKNISVMMPYADSLKYISDWYAQLWAESIGKKYNTHNDKIFAGQTPVKALGATDQHSQIQLYTEGPLDKVVTFIRVENYKSDIKIPLLFEDIPGVSFLGGHSLQELIKIEQHATAYALTKANRPNITITLPQVNPFTIGQLLFMFEVQTAFMGELLEINAFDQPGVEEGKNVTYALMGRPGYEEKKKELDNEPKKSSKYII